MNRFAVQSLLQLAGMMALLSGGVTSAMAAPQAEVAKAAASPEVQFDYYPSFNRCTVRIDGRKWPERAEVQTAALILRQDGVAMPVATKKLSLTDTGLTETEWSLPTLAEGGYELIVQLEGAKIPEKHFHFERHFFPWEHNSLGRSDIVVPPFTPLRVDHRRVETILRQHELTSLGLWSQVTSLGANLLTRPMRLELVQNGKTREVVGRKFRITTQTATRVVTEAEFKGGRAKGEWSYDGLLRWTLDLEPSAEPIEALTLIVPLDERQAPLMHACTDGLRINYAGAVPAGMGRIWDGSKAGRRIMGGSYVPYLWLGGEERGLAVFGENERGWVTAEGVSCQELRRGPGGLELRLNLVSGHEKIDTPRRIVLGFQATPTKPMPDNWRLTTMDYPGGARPGGTNIRFIGSEWGWGAPTPCTSAYPRDGDFSLWDEFARARQAGRVDPAYLEKWLERVPAGEERELARRETGYGYHKVAASGAEPVVVYTNPRGVRLDTPEGRTFLSEWDRFSYSKREWDGTGIWFDANLAESFQDYYVWHYHRMLETFADGIYWDNTFLQSTYVPVGTDAFRLADGSMRPAVGLWAMRELIRRTAVLDCEMHRPAHNMLHITNAAVAPVLAYGQMLLTWEDQKGDADFQDRHSREYLRAESIGRQHGMVPFGMVLTTSHDPAKIAWIRRTAAGVALVHEVKFGGGDKAWQPAFQKLLDFGYGRPDVTVYNYWQKEMPVSLSSPDAAVLCLTKEGAMMIVVCSYGVSGLTELQVGGPWLKSHAVLLAADVENGLALPVTVGGKVTFEIKRHDFRIILITEQGAKGAAATTS